MASDYQTYPEEGDFISADQYGLCVQFATGGRKEKALHCRDDTDMVNVDFTPDAQAFVTFGDTIKVPLVATAGSFYVRIDRTTGAIKQSFTLPPQMMTGMTKVTVPAGASTAIVTLPKESGGVQARFRSGDTVKPAKAGANQAFITVRKVKAPKK